MFFSTQLELLATDGTRIEHGLESVFHPCPIRGSISSDFGLRPLILTLFSSPPNLKKSFGEWCNGSTADSGSACLGSNPSSPASDHRCIWRQAAHYSGRTQGRSPRKFQVVS